MGSTVDFQCRLMIHLAVFKHTDIHIEESK